MIYILFELKDFIYLSFSIIVTKGKRQGTITLTRIGFVHNRFPHNHQRLHHMRSSIIYKIEFSSNTQRNDLRLLNYLDVKQILQERKSYNNNVIVYLNIILLSIHINW